MNNNCDVYGVNFIPRTNAADNADVRGTEMQKQVYAMAYVPDQRSIDPQYSPEDALKAGTVFKYLDLPWEGVRYCD